MYHLFTFSFVSRTIVLRGLKNSDCLEEGEIIVVMQFYNVAEAELRDTVLILTALQYNAAIINKTPRIIIQMCDS